MKFFLPWILTFVNINGGINDGSGIKKQDFASTRRASWTVGDYLFGKRAVVPYRWLYIGFIVLGSVRSLDDVINFCDAMNGLMALPNLVSLIALSPLVAKLTSDYMQRRKSS